jgi:hypothetical protein
MKEIYIFSSFFFPMVPDSGYTKVIESGSNPDPQPAFLSVIQSVREKKSIKSWLHTYSIYLSLWLAVLWPSFTMEPTTPTLPWFCII